MRAYPDGLLHGLHTIRAQLVKFAGGGKCQELLA